MSVPTLVPPTLIERTPRLILALLARATVLQLKVSSLVLAALLVGAQLSFPEECMSLVC